MNTAVIASALAAFGAAAVTLILDWVRERHSPKSGVAAMADQIEADTRKTSSQLTEIHRQLVLQTTWQSLGERHREASSKLREAQMSQEALRLAFDAFRRHAAKLREHLEDLEHERSRSSD